MVNENELKRQMEDFQKAVKRLGDTVNKSGVDWHDAQFVSLLNSIKSVAASSKQVLIIGSQCSSAVKRFIAIESEK